jgi:hypothetical protein
MGNYSSCFSEPIFVTLNDKTRKAKYCLTRKQWSSYKCFRELFVQLGIVSPGVGFKIYAGSLVLHPWSEIRIYQDLIIVTQNEQSIKICIVANYRKNLY